MPTKKAVTAKKAANPVADAIREDNAKQAAAAEPKKASTKYADDDNSIDARMWRLEQDHIRMGARPK